MGGLGSGDVPSGVADHPVCASSLVSDVTIRHEEGYDRIASPRSRMSWWCCGIPGGVGDPLVWQCWSLRPEVPRLSVAMAFWLMWRRSFQVISSFLLVKSGMTVIVTRMDGVWRVVDVICVDGGARNPKTPILF